ncbi:MAG: helix-turn-helix domain-containing protein [Burkholderiaceae bacterium]
MSAPLADQDAIVWTSAARSMTRVCGPLSIRAVWGGSEVCTIGRRTLVIDEDSYLVSNGGREYTAQSERRSGGDSLTVFFSEATQSSCVMRRDFFGEHLRPHGGAISQYLQRILEARKCRVTDNRWYSNQLRALYRQLVLEDDELLRKSAVFAPATLSTRSELFRRVMAATDFINSNYMSTIVLNDIASAAHLSKYHLARVFRAYHGVSPAAYLRLKRIRTAERLIARSDADLAEIAERSGFGSRWSMFRELHKRRGMSGQRIRESWARSSALATPA